MVFFMGGPQLGELEAGLLANWAGPVVSVVSGGLGCIAATAWLAAVTPALRQYRRTPPDATRAPRGSMLEDIQVPANPVPED